MNCKTNKANMEVD